MNKSRDIVIFVLIVAGLAFFFSRDKGESVPFRKSSIRQAEKLSGLQFGSADRKLMMEDLSGNLEKYEGIRNLKIPNSVQPSIQFNPTPIGVQFDRIRRTIRWSPIDEVSRPDNLEELAFASVAELAELILTRQVSSTELTKMYLERLKEHGPTLQCVVTLTEELALKQAARADAEIAAGKYRGPLHGIPYGAKDLLAVKGYKTTWGAMPYKDQMIDENSTVVKKLEEAGAVLVAKLTLGALAWGDVWFGGKTKNPWNLEEGSSGSSAGSGSATAAGLVAFAIGTETWGSIVSPSTRCGVTGLRPTFGRVSRAGAMALSWSMDKIGPMCRTVEDCAIVFNAIYGPDGLDQSLIDLPFNYNADVDLTGLRIGYLKSAFEGDYTGKDNDEASLKVLRELGVDLIPFELPEFPVENISFILWAEAAAAFDELTRSGQDELMVRQIQRAWPNVFRASRFIPAVEYIQANRARHILIQKMAEQMKAVDLFVTPSFGGNNLLVTNLTGHPCVVVPNGFKENGSPTSISFIGQLYDEGTILAVAKAYQDATDWHKQHPSMFIP
ncbi:MAG: amidase [Candidatus Marinimicrobia bacterium]|jgi:Asp-tRNA(Asn)/Glu-tRNA(Gln) amidotransferase A subunit family amidase|nr:amidase [Candidatus Neomarinimicrobiota bacterium]MDP7060047.1 amidase [Candidatus Neomarinimicrobiota bacterium]|tara:strand:- start:29 stop:1696 length:1668 start_codon:yes stop_codon:yes gene_type:complete